MLLSNPVETVNDVRRRESGRPNPIGCPRLKDLARPGQKVAIIVTDISEAARRSSCPSCSMNWKRRECPWPM